MSPLNVVAVNGEERISKAKVTGLILGLIGTWRIAESMFAFHLLPPGVEDKVGVVVDVAFTIGGYLVIIFRGKKG